MDRIVEFLCSGGSARRLALHGGLLLAALAVPFLLFDLGTAALTAIGSGLAVLLFQLAVIIRRDRDRPKKHWKLGLLLGLFNGAIPIATIGLLFFLIIEWNAWAYRPINGAHWDAIAAGLIVVAAVLIFPPILFLLLAPRFGKSDGGPASRFLAGIRRRGYAWFGIDWLGGVLVAGAVMALFSLLFVEGLARIETARDADGAVTIRDFLAAYPYVPFLLAGIVALLALALNLGTEPQKEELTIRAYSDQAAGVAGPDRRRLAALAVLAATAFLTALLSIGYPAHLYVKGRSAIDSVGKTLDATADALRALARLDETDGTSPARVVELLNRVGYWEPETPLAGLGALVENPEDIFPENCTVRVAAGTIAPWPAGADQPEVKLCVVVACTPPVAWETPPQRVLVSSHDSGKEGWRGKVFWDIFTEARAPEPGGYCNADGTLADSYRG